MTVKHGREFLAIPGPTTIPDEVLRAMHRPAIDIFDEDLIETTERCVSGLKHIFRTGGDIYRSEEHTSELQSRTNLVCRLLLETKN